MQNDESLVVLVESTFSITNYVALSDPLIIPVVEKDVWCPDKFRRQTNTFHATVVVWVPFQPVV